jgi:anti-sigma B factor antagonist
VGADARRFERHQPFAVQIDRSADSVVITVSGEFDITCRREFEARTRDVLDRRVRRLVLDLTNMSFMDSTALGQILELWSWSRRHECDFAVVRPSEHLYQAFETAGVLDELPFVDSPLPRRGAD